MRLVVDEGSAECMEAYGVEWKCMDWSRLLCGCAQMVTVVGA
eukprot:ctg_804.g271